MSEVTNNKFSKRGFVSALTALSFIAMTVTGLVLFVTPPGRFANWTDWRMFGLTKHQWGATHIWLSLLFLGAAGFHIYLNWRPMISYFKSRITRHLGFRREWVLALVLCIIVGTGTLAEIPPFSSLMELNETAKHSWENEKPEVRPPIPHAELMTLRELADNTGANLEEMIANLKAKGIVVESTQVVISDLANQHNMTPLQLYNIAVGQTGIGQTGGQGQGQGARGGGMGRGMGHKTLEQFCADEGLDITGVLENLHGAGIDAEAEMILHDIADKAGIRPPDLLEILKNKR